MTPQSASSWMKPAVRVAAAGFGAAVAGPLGGALGGWLGAALGGSAAHLVEKYAETFGDKAGEKLLETGADSLVESLKDSAPDLEGVYREVLRQSLAEVRANAPQGFNDWFDNWDLCLKAHVALDLPPTHRGQLVPENLDALFITTLERLDAQGAAIQQGGLSIQLQCRTIPAQLLSELNSHLPRRLEETIRVVLVKPEYEQGWKQAQLIFQADV